MNLIACAKDCKHQREGYCGLKGVEAVTSSANDCCHYSSKQSFKTASDTQSHSMKNSPLVKQ